MLKKVVLGLVLITLIAGAGVGFYIFIRPKETKLTQLQKEEALTKLLGRKVNFQEKEVPQGNDVFQGKYVTFEYPKRAEIYDWRDEGFKKTPQGLESFSFFTKQPKMLFTFVVMGVDTRFVNSVNDDASVLMRHRSRGAYKETEIAAGGINGLAYEKAGMEGEKSAFFFHNNRIYSFAFTGSDMEEMTSVFDTLIKSLKFLD